MVHHEFSTPLIHPTALRCSRPGIRQQKFQDSPSCIKNSPLSEKTKKKKFWVSPTYVSPPHVLQSSPAVPSFPSLSGHYVHDGPQQSLLLMRMQALASSAPCLPSASSIDLVCASHIQNLGRDDLVQIIVSAGHIRKIWWKVAHREQSPSKALHFPPWMFLMPPSLQPQGVGSWLIVRHEVRVTYFQRWRYSLKPQKLTCWRLNWGFKL